MGPLSSWRKVRVEALLSTFGEETQEHQEDAQEHHRDVVKGVPGERDPP
jgi:hypothetical protein